MAEAVVLSSRVRLARNYEDLPFDTALKPELAEQCISRTVNAAMLAGLGDAFTLIRLSDMGETQRSALAESRLVSRDLLRRPDTAAILLNEADAQTVMINEDDHLRIQALCAGGAIETAADRCFQLDDAFSRHARFAYDAQLGYLTACPTNTGTGMRASLLLHLPMLASHKQMGNVGQIVAKFGLTIRGVYGEGSEALGDLYQVSNQVTLGRTEQEILSTVRSVGRQLTDMEYTLQARALREERTVTEDSVYRAWAILTSARLLDSGEFFRLWSAGRLGAMIGLLPADTDRFDSLLTEAQDAHLRSFNEAALEGDALREARAARVRRLLLGHS